MKMDKRVMVTLDEIKTEINKKYGYHENTPRINYGPCGVFALIFYNKWNELFDKKVHICFVLTPSMDECDHIVIRLPSGELYDGGIGIHTDNLYLPKFLIEDMTDYDECVLEKWSYGLDRAYPRFCPDFNRTEIEALVNIELNKLYQLIGQNIFE